MDEVEADPQAQGSDLNEQQVSSRQKIYRRGDKIYKMPNENITMLNTNFPNVTNGKTKIPRPDESVEIDRIDSGESLFKTFTFDQKISEEETEKCITFWRSVVEKHLEPIKCTLIADANSRMDADTQKRDSTSSKQRKKSTSITNDPVKCPAPKTEEKEKNKWNEILIELQKKKIAQAKLQLEKKCRFCGYLNSPAYETLDPNQQNKDMIAELDDWKPRSFKQTDTKLLKKGSKGGRRASVTSKTRSSTVTPTVGGESPGLETVLEANEEEVRELHKAEQRKLEEIKIASLNIQHVDLIAEKKKKGLYSQWRRNSLADCECDRTKCDCNTNMGIKSITLDPSSKQHRRSASSRVSDGTAASKQHDDAIIVVPKIPDQNSIDVSIEVTSPDFLLKQTHDDIQDLVSTGSSKNEAKEVTISEDIRRFSEAVHHRDSEFTTTQDMQNYDIPHEVSKPRPEKQSLDELYKGKVATDDHSSDEAIGIIQQADNISQTGSLPDPSRRPRKSILVSEEDRLRSKSFESRKSMKSISVMLKCACSYEKCDCRSVVKLPEKLRREISIPPPPKLKAKSVQRVNSLTLLKRRLSSVSATSEPDEVFSKVESSKPELPRGRSGTKSVDSIEIIRRRLSTMATDQEEDDDDDDDERDIVPRARAVSITFK